MRRPAARRAVSRVGAVACTHCSGWLGSAGWSPPAGARRRRMVPRHVTLVSVSWVRAWPHSMGGIQTCWPWALWRARQSTRFTMASWRPLPGVVKSWRALTVSLIQLSCMLYQPGGVLRALPWRVARRRSGSRMVVGVRGGCSGSGGGGGGGASWVGCRGPARLRRCMGGPGWLWLGWAAPGGLVGERWALACRGWLWRGGLVVGPGGLLGCSGGVLEACGRRWGGGACVGRGVG